MGKMTTTQILQGVRDWTLQQMSGKANTEGDYPKISAGSAKNINKDINVVSSFIERTSGGDEEIANGLAKLSEVGGKSVLFNQLQKRTTSSLVKQENGVTFSTSQDGAQIIAVVAEGGVTDASWTYVSSTSPANISLIAGHKYLLKGCPKGGGVSSFGLTNALYDVGFDYGSGHIFTADNTHLSFSYDFYFAIGTPEGTYVAKPQLFDLTLMFGAGNEPATTAEFDAWLASNFGLKEYYPYTPNTVLNVTMNGIESTNRNLLDPTTGKAELIGAYSEIYGNYYAIRGTYTSLSLESIDGEVTTPTPDADGKFLVEKKSIITINGAGADCIVFLWWDGTQTSFVEHKVDNARVDIPCIYGKANGAGELVEVFPDGACGIGDNKDLLTIESGVAVVKKLIGKRAYASGDESDSDVITDGTNTYYVLTTPITYTDLVYVGSSYYDDNTPVTLPVNYEVDNWGIERITSEGLTVVPQISCKYSIDIVETVNTQNDLIEKLEKEKLSISNLPSTTVGRAENLTGEKLPVTTGYTLKATGYDPSQPELEFADGLVNMTEIRGRACAWNQIITADDYRTPPTGMTINGNKITVAAGTYPDSLVFSFVDQRFVSINKKSYVSGHRYYLFGAHQTMESCYLRDPEQNASAINAKGVIYTAANDGGIRFNIMVSVGATLTQDAVFEPQFIDLTILNPTLAAKENLTVAEVEAYLASIRTPKPYYAQNAGTLLGARMMGWQLRKTANLLNPTTKQAKLFEYAYIGHDNEYTVNGLPSDAAVKFIEDKVGDNLPEVTNLSSVEILQDSSTTAVNNLINEIPVGHKVYLRAKRNDTNTSSLIYLALNNEENQFNVTYGIYLNNNSRFSSTILTFSAFSFTRLYLYNGGGVSYDISAIRVIDLTATFGAGNEPATPAEAELALFGIVTPDANNRFTIPSRGVASIINSGSMQPYDGDITRTSIIATWDGSMDGKVVAYDEDNVEIDSANIYYDNNGVKTQVFEGGVLKSTGDGAGDIRDRVYFNEIEKKWKSVQLVGDVDLGTLNWRVESSYEFPRFISVEEIPSTSEWNKCICGKYGLPSTNMGIQQEDKTIRIFNVDHVAVRDSSYETASAFKTAMNGVHLFYELAIPITHDTLYYKVGNDYVPMEEVFPNGIQGLCCNWASENLAEQAEVDGQPQSITPVTTEVFQSDYKELLKTIGDTYISKEQAKDSFDNLLSVVAEALLYLYNENKALRDLLTGNDNAVLPVVKAQSVECDDILTLGVPNMLYSGVEGAPSAANVPDNWDEETMTVWDGCPRKIGQQYVDKVSGKVYYAIKVTGSTGDWVLLN